MNIENPQNNQKKLWFRAKCFGWGWTPVTWQGWLVVLLFVIGIIYFSQEMGKTPLFALLVAILTALLIGICYLKGEKPRWRWGDCDKS